MSASAHAPPTAPDPSLPPKAALQQVDPTQTTTLRTKKYKPKLTKRFRALKGAINTTLVENDALRLSETALAPDDLSPRDDFGFGSNARKQAGFERWLTLQLNEGVLERLPKERVLDGQHFTAPFVRAASRRGTNHALQTIAQSDVATNYDVSEVDLSEAFNTGVHQDLLKSVYLRNYRALEGITADVDKEISRVLSEGLTQGLGPRDLASNLNDRVDAIGFPRSETVARSETLYAYNEHALTEYERAGVEEIGVAVEWLATEDSRICGDCASLAGTTYTIEEARGLLPYHPNCRCTFVTAENN